MAQERWSVLRVVLASLARLETPVKRCGALVLVVGATMFVIGVCQAAKYSHWDWAFQHAWQAALRDRSDYRRYWIAAWGAYTFGVGLLLSFAFDWTLGPLWRWVRQGSGSFPRPKSEPVPPKAPPLTRASWELDEEPLPRKARSLPPKPWTYYDWEEAPITCPMCKWSGLGAECTTSEGFNDGSERCCPSCSYEFGFVLYPLLTEAASDPRAEPIDRDLARHALAELEREQGR